MSYLDTVRDVYLSAFFCYGKVCAKYVTFFRPLLFCVSGYGTIFLAVTTMLLFSGGDLFSETGSGVCSLKL